MTHKKQSRLKELFRKRNQLEKQLFRVNNQISRLVKNTKGGTR